MAKGLRKLSSKGDKLMRKITNLIPVGLVSLGLTLTLGSAAFADPSARYGLRDRSSGALQLNRDYYLHKRIYGNGQNHDRKEFSGAKALEHDRGPDAAAGVESPARPDSAASSAS
jgi:hypothetical protein